MKSQKIFVPEKKLIGISVRTRNDQEMNESTSKIKKCVDSYWGQNITNEINFIRDTYTSFCVYTDYESDFNGYYTFFIGQEVETFSGQEEKLSQCIIPSQEYIKFTVGPGSMPQVVINGWEKIWNMSSNELNGTRTYKADFEIYDKREQNLNEAVVDICIGIDSDK